MIDRDKVIKQKRDKFYHSTIWRQTRKKVLERDNYECQWCKEQGKVTTATDDVLEVDHIKTYEVYPELGIEMDNLRTLCRTCHNKRHGREHFWSEKDSEKKIYRQDEWWGTPPT